MKRLPSFYFYRDEFCGIVDKFRVIVCDLWKTQSNLWINPDKYGYPHGDNIGSFYLSNLVLDSFYLRLIDQNK